MTILGFEQMRRQRYITQESLHATLEKFDSDQATLEDNLAREAADPVARSEILQIIAARGWRRFQLLYTAGQDLPTLAQQLEKVVSAYEAYSKALDEVPEAQYHPPFAMDDVIDEYVDYLNILSAAILLRREDLVPRIHAVNEGTRFDEYDAIVEDLLSFYLPDRPQPNQWIWKQYEKLLDVIDSQDESNRQDVMNAYVAGWYSSMKGAAHFWGKHEKIKPSFSPYSGYWAMCAGAFTYLYGIDDSSYRSELVYPKDMVDYARNTPRRVAALGAETQC
jgi:hypothetical protein